MGGKTAEITVCLYLSAESTKTDKPALPPPPPPLLKHGHRPLSPLCTSPKASRSHVQHQLVGTWCPAVRAGSGWPGTLPPVGHAAAMLRVG